MTTNLIHFFAAGVYIYMIYTIIRLSKNYWKMAELVAILQLKLARREIVLKELLAMAKHEIKGVEDGEEDRNEPASEAVHKDS